MKKLQRLLIALVTAVVCLSPLEAQAQTGRIAGRIVDSNTLGPLADVEVSVADRVVVSDPDGRFVITDVTAGTYTLRASRLGYGEVERSVTVVAGQTTNVDISMRVAAVELEELVAIGYGQQQERDLTGVVKEVSTEEFNTGRIVSPEQLIQAKVAGVQVEESNGGEPGGGISIRIRGGTSVNASNEPLFVVDGMPLSVGGGISAGRNPLEFLNPEDIQSMTVLKDASATAIYGSRGANGVVLIETRGGHTEVGGVGTRLSYNGTMSGSYIAGEPDVLTTQQFRDAVEQYNPDAISLLGSENTDWREAIQRNGFGQEHTVAFSGATNSLDYRLSVGYLNQEGVIRGSTTERATIGLGFRQFFFEDKLRLTANLRGARINDEFTPGVIGSATIFAPTQPIMDPTNTDNGGYFEWRDLSTALNNPVAELELTEDHGTTYRSVGDIEAQFQVPYVAGLSGNVRFGYDATKAEREQFQPSFLRGQFESGRPGWVRRANSTQSNVLFDMYGTYSRRFAPLGGTDFTATAGYSYEESNAEFPEFEAQGLSFDVLGVNGVPASEFQRTAIFVDESRLISFFGRTLFTFADRYLLTLSVRRDGSSKFGPDNQWGTFPSVAFAWRISSEPFMQDRGPFSDLKLRLSWGKNGNQEIPNYLWTPSYDIGEPTAQYQFGDEFVATIRPGAADRGIKWEETTSTNIGLDFGLANNRYTGAIDYYFKKTEDLLFRVPVAAGTFTTNFITTNIGTVENRGLELTLGALLAEGRDGGFSWNADFNAATNSNELVQINPFASGGDVILTGGISGAVGNFIQVLQPGQPVNSFYVYQHKRGPDGKPIFDEDPLLMYEDVNEDGVINQDDRVPFESPAPTWILGHTSRMTWRSFDASFTLRAYLGNYVYNNVASNFGHYRALSYVGAPNNLHASVLETGFESEQYFSDYYVEDASFLRMDNLTLGYTIPVRAGTQMRIFGTVQNLFTLTGYDGVDPLAGVNGIDNNLYPRSRTFTLGANVWF